MDLQLVSENDQRAPALIPPDIEQDFQDSFLKAGGQPGALFVDGNTVDRLMGWSRSTRIRRIAAGEIEAARDGGLVRHPLASIKNLYFRMRAAARRAA